MAYIQQSIPFLPDNSSWDDWNGNMLHYFGEEPLPRVPEIQWQEFGKAFISLATFSSYSLPNPENFILWQDWVSSMITTINGRSQ